MNPAEAIARALVQPVALERKLTSRPYQSEAALAITAAALEGRSAELRLPPGTGKTIIADFVALAFRTARPGARVVLTAPRRALAAQHAAYARWAYPALRTLLVNDERMARPARLTYASEAAGLIIGLPGQLASALRRAVIPPDVAASIGLVLVDEFDEFLTEDFEIAGPRVRLEEDFRRLVDALPAAVPFALMSGSAPGALETQEPTVQRLAAFVASTWEPVIVVPDEAAYAEFTPTARVTFLGVHDAEVARLSEAVETDMILALTRLEDIVGPFDASRVLPLLSGVLSGRIARLPTNGGLILVTPAIRSGCAAIQGAINRYAFLYEDMFDGYDAALCDIWVRGGEDGMIKLERQQFVTRPKDGEHHPKPRGKLQALKGLVEGRPGQRGVVMVRFVRLAERLAAELAGVGRRVHLLHGGQADAERDAALAGFRGERDTLLIMTRDTGKRGLDLPEADYAVVYSPKSREATVWQELNRIRSTATITKDSYVLVYDHSREAARSAELADLMAASGRAYEVLRCTD